MPDKRNIRDHKRRLLAAKYEFIRKKASLLFQDAARLVRSCPSRQERVPLHDTSCLRPMLCIDTGRPRGVVEFFRIYHIVFRGLASRGRSGLKKSSFLVGHQTNRKTVSSAAGPQARRAAVYYRPAPDRNGGVIPTLLS